MSVTTPAVLDVNTTVAVDTVPDANTASVPLQVPPVTGFPVVAPAASDAKPAATSAAVIVPVAVRVSPATVTDWPAVKFWNTTEADSVVAATPWVVVSAGAVGSTPAAVPSTVIEMSVTFVFGVPDVNITVAVDAAPELNPVKVPSHVPLATTFPSSTPSCSNAKPAATSSAVIVPVAIKVSPATVTDWPEIRSSNTTDADSVTAASPWVVVVTGAVGSATGSAPSTVIAMSSTSSSPMSDVNTTVADDADPERKSVKAPLQVPSVTGFPVVAPSASDSKPTATSAAVIVPVAVKVSPATVTDWPEIRPSNTTEADSVTAAAPGVVVASGSVGSATASVPSTVIAMSSTTPEVLDVNTTVAVDAAPELNPVKVPFQLLPVPAVPVAPTASEANAAATSLSAIVAVAVKVSPATVTDWPAVRPSKTTEDDSVVAATP